MLRRRAGVAAALAAAGRGLALFPLPPGARLPTPGWQRQCTTDPGKVARLAALGNLGVGCRASDVVALDLDRHPGEANGIARFAAACAAAGARWPDTFTVATPHGGLHLYFAAAGRPIPSISGGRTGLGPGIDTRGPGVRSGGYLLAPGSHVAGGLYALEHDAPVAVLPEWLAPLLDRVPPASPKRTASGRGRALPRPPLPQARSRRVR